MAIRSTAFASNMTNVSPIGWSNGLRVRNAIISSPTQRVSWEAAESVYLVVVPNFS